MDEKDVIATLCKLEEMDRDAVQAYQDAIAKTSDAEVRDQLEEFRMDHARHVQAIGETLRRQGWPHPEATPEFQALMQGFRRQVDMAEGGDDAVMVAMDLGEMATNAEYAEALQMDVDDDVRQVLQADFADEQRHLAFVEKHMPGQFGGGMAHVSGAASTAEAGGATGGAGAYGGMGGDVGPGGGGGAGAIEQGTRDVTGGGDVTGDYGMGSRHQGQRLQGRVPASGGADMSTEQSRPRGGLNADVRKRRESKGSEMAGGGTGSHEEHPNFGGQVEGDSGSSGSGVAGSGSGD